MDDKEDYTHRLRYVSVEQGQVNDYGTIKCTHARGYVKVSHGDNAGPWKCMDCDAVVDADNMVVSVTTKRPDSPAFTVTHK